MHGEPENGRRVQANLFEEFGAASAVLSPKYIGRMLASPTQKDPESKLQSILTWRREQGMDTWTAERFSGNSKFSRWLYTAGRDTADRPILYIHIGAIPFSSIDVDLFVEYWFFILDQHLIAHDDDAFTMIVDVANATSVACLGCARQMCTQFIAFYPERLGRVVVTPAVRLSKWVYGILQRVLPAEITARVSLVGEGKETREATDALYAAPSDVPTFMSGERVVPYSAKERAATPIAEMFDAECGGAVYLGAYAELSTARAPSLKALYALRERQYLRDGCADAALVDDTLRSWVAAERVRAETALPPDGGAAAAPMPPSATAAPPPADDLADVSDFQTCDDHTTDEEGRKDAAAPRGFDVASLRRSLAAGERSGADDLSAAAQRRILLQAMEILERLPVSAVLQYSDAIVQQRLRGGSGTRRSGAALPTTTGAVGGGGGASGGRERAGSDDSVLSVQSNGSEFSLSNGAASGMSGAVEAASAWRRGQTRAGTRSGQRLQRRHLLIRGGFHVLLRSSLFKRATNGLRKWHERIVYLTTSFLAWRTVRADDAERASAGIKKGSAALEKDLAMHSRRIVPVASIASVVAKRGVRSSSNSSSGGGGSSGGEKSAATKFPFGVTTRGGEELLFFATTSTERSAWSTALNEIISFTTIER